MLTYSALCARTPGVCRKLQPLPARAESSPLGANKSVGNHRRRRKSAQNAGPPFRNGRWAAGQFARSDVRSSARLRGTGSAHLMRGAWNNALTTSCHALTHVDESTGTYQLDCSGAHSGYCEALTRWPHVGSHSESRNRRGSANVPHRTPTTERCESSYGGKPSGVAFGGDQGLTRTHDLRLRRPPIFERMCWRKGEPELVLSSSCPERLSTFALSRFRVEPSVAWNLASRAYAPGRICAITSR